MRLLIISTACLIGAFAFAGCDGNSMEKSLSKSERLDQVEQQLEASDAINNICPRSGEPVASNSLTTYRGHTVGFCNQHCRDDFASDPNEAESDRTFFDDIISKL